MSQLYVNNIKSRVGGAVSFSQGIISAGATFTGNVSVGGTLTYEDVTNVNVTGIITANNGISVPSGGIVVTGVVTATSFSGNGANLTNLNIPASFNELDATLFS